MLNKGSQQINGFHYFILSPHLQNNDFETNLDSKKTQVKQYITLLRCMQVSSLDVNIIIFL